MTHSLCLLLISAALLAAQEAKPADWPMANGPTGNFNPRRYGHALVDDLKDARQLWLSEDKDLGFAKGSASGYVGHLTDPETHPGTASGLIVAEGKVFASSFRPTGDIWPEEHVQIGASYKAGKWPGEKGEALKRNSAIDADDLTLALDLRTGKTVWKAVEKGKGINRYSGKRLQFHATPAYHAGKVFSLGTTGILYAYDAATGKKLWEDATGSLAREMPAIKEKLLREKKDVAGGGGMGASLVVADGVLVVPQFGIKGGSDIPLRGVDVETGKTLWEVPAASCRFATPAVWTHAGRQYVLVATVGMHGKPADGKLRLIDPKAGRVLWTLDGLTPTCYSLSPSEKHVLVNVPSKTVNPKKEKDGQSWGLMAAVRLTPEKAERSWTMPDKPELWFENHMDICAMRRVLIRDGLVYFYSQGHTVDPSKSSRFFSILKEETGELLYTSKDGEFKLGQFWLVEDRLLNIPDAAHSDRATVELLTSAPADVRRLGPEWKPPQKSTTAYEVFIELPYVDGLFLMRAYTGHVACYDLRKAK